MVKFLITSLDVSLFLMESLVKAVGPMVMDGGSLAAARVSQTLTGSIMMPMDVVDGRGQMKKGGGQWKMYDQFKKPLEISD